MFNAVWFSGNIFISTEVKTLFEGITNGPLALIKIPSSNNALFKLKFISFFCRRDFYFIVSLGGREMGARASVMALREKKIKFFSFAEYKQHV